MSLHQELLGFLRVSKTGISHSKSLVTGFQSPVVAHERFERIDNLAADISPVQNPAGKCKYLVTSLLRY
jgi:hypothetical protein